MSLWLCYHCGHVLIEILTDNKQYVWCDCKNTLNYLFVPTLF